MARRRNEDPEEIERQFEEKIEARRRRVPVSEYRDSNSRDKQKPKAPVLLRFLAWCGVILFCFVVGYVGTGYMVTDLFNLNKQWPGSGGETGTSAVEAVAVGMDMQRATLTVFYPRSGQLVSETVDVISRTFEDNIQEAMLRLLRLNGMDTVNVLHVFRDADTVYLDLSAPFLEALNELGQNAGSLLLNGVVRTMSDNFSLTKVRFLVNSSVPTSGTPFDLTAAWQ